MPKSKETVEEFSAQWSSYDFTGEKWNEYFHDVLGPLMSVDEIKGKCVADVGAGNGRFTQALAQMAGKVWSVEPAPGAMANNKQLNQQYSNVTFLAKKAEDLPECNELDIVFCIGVLHHIPDMLQAIKGMKNLLKEDGKLVVWVYGKENNRLYLFFTGILRLFTTLIPDRWLMGLSKRLVPIVKGYGRLANRYAFVPMAAYFVKVLNKVTDKELETIIFDQLNPSTARYLSKKDINALFYEAGMPHLTLYHRHKYSWTVLAQSS